MTTHPRNPVPAILATAATIGLAALLAVATTRHDQRSDAVAPDYAVVALDAPITSR